MNVIALLDPINTMLVGASAINAGNSNWLLLAPINADRSSYSPLIMLVVILAVVLLTMQIVHRHYHGRVRKAPPWDCGFPRRHRACKTPPRDSASRSAPCSNRSSGSSGTLPSPFDSAPRYSVKAEDHFWSWFYVPIVRGAETLARLVGYIQQGRISVYLDLQFLHAARLVVPGAMSISRRCGFLSQLLQLAIALVLAPLLVGWVNQVPCLALEQEPRRRSCCPTG